MPVDASLQGERDLDFEAVSLDFVLKQMELEREGKTNVVFLDACRPSRGRDTLRVPDVGDRRGELDVAYPLTPHLGPGDLDTAALADDALEADPLVLAAVTLPVPGGAEDLLENSPPFSGFRVR